MKYIIYGLLGYLVWALCILVVPDDFGYGMLQLILRLIGALLIGVFVSRKKYKTLYGEKNDFKCAFFYFCKHDLLISILLALLWSFNTGSSLSSELFFLFFGDGLQGYSVFAQYIYSTFLDVYNILGFLFFYLSYAITRSVYSQ